MEPYGSCCLAGFSSLLFKLQRELLGFRTSSSVSGKGFVSCEGCVSGGAAPKRPGASPRFAPRSVPGGAVVLSHRVLLRVPQGLGGVWGGVNV